MDSLQLRFHPICLDMRTFFVWTVKNLHNYTQILTLVQTNDVYFAVTMLTLYVADIQTIQPATLSLKRTTHTHTYAQTIREPKKKRKKKNGET